MLMFAWQNCDHIRSKHSIVWWSWQCYSRWFQQQWLTRTRFHSEIFFQIKTAC